MSLRLATYNVHRCIGTDGRRDLERVLAVVRAIDADVLALQEIETFPDRRGDFLKLMAEATDYRIEAGPALKRLDCDYGNALLSRLPVASVARRDLSVPGREPRGAILARLVHDDGLFVVAATHLGRRGRERRQQISLLFRALDASSAGTRSPMEVLMGDLNEWSPFSGAVRRLRQRFPARQRPATYPSRFPILPLDGIWFRRAPAAFNLRIHSMDPAPNASDHLPLIAEY